MQIWEFAELWMIICANEDWYFVTHWEYTTNRNKYRLTTVTLTSFSFVTKLQQASVKHCGKKL